MIEALLFIPPFFLFEGLASDYEKSLILTFVFGDLLVLCYDSRVVALTIVLSGCIEEVSAAWSFFFSSSS